jgi:hypothetical protein
MNGLISTLIRRFEDNARAGTNVIPWSCPVPAFGDLSRSKIATVGLNPSNREFVDGSGNELEGSSRRFHTLKSLGLARWADVNARHLQLIVDSCSAYFSRNPYDRWFRKLDHVISGTTASYYHTSVKACHLDLIPYATARKWTELTQLQRSSLLAMAGDTLGLLLRDSPVRLLILNGRSVVENFQDISGVCLEKHAMSDWALPRQSKRDVAGFAYMGRVRSISGTRLKHEILVLGFNHNIQSSFGVTTGVTTAIRHWIAQTASETI